MSMMLYRRVVLVMRLPQRQYAKSAKFGAAYLRAPSNAPMIAHAYVRGTAGGYEAGYLTE